MQGGSNTRSPLLEPAHYGYWKSKMQSFISAIDGAWDYVETLWKALLLDDGNPKPRSNWTVTEKAASGLNHRALTAIFNGVNPTEFKRISNYKTTL